MKNLTLSLASRFNFLVVKIPVLILLCGLSTACSKFTALGDGGASILSIPPPDEEPIPKTDKIDTECMTSSDYDACIFLKGPVSQAKRTIAAAGADKQDLQSIQHFGVKLVNVDDNGFLKNPDFEILTVYGAPFQKGVDQKIAAASDTENKIEQLMAHYWLNRAVAFLEASEAVLPMKSKAIKVIVDDTTAGWRSATNTIHLKKEEGGKAMALDAGVMIHFLGQASIFHAKNGLADAPAPANHQLCGKDEAGCCTSANGCYKAIASGASDYMAALVFKEDPNLGASWLNRMTGLGFCGMNRGLNDASSLSAQQSFDACAASGGSGEVHTMGTVYASIWWEVRKQAIQQTPATGGKDMDKLYIDHLAQISGADTFATIKGKIEQLDQANNGGKYSGLFTAEFAKRGL